MNKGDSRMRKIFMRYAGLVWGMILYLSPEVLGASSGSEHAEVESPFALLMRVVNFVLLIGLLYFLLKKPLRNFLNKRQQGVREALEAAQNDREKAEARYQDVERKLERAKKEIEDLKRMLVEQGQMEKDKILASAKQEAEKIRRDAEVTAEQELKKAYLLLRQEAVELASNLAETLLKDKIKEEDHERLLQDYLETLGKTN